MAYAAKVEYGGSDVPITSTLYAECSTAGSTADKSITLTDITNLITGMTIKIKFQYANTAVNPRLLINATDAKPIMRNGNQAVGTRMEDSWPDKSIVSLTYDGTNWIIDGWLNTDTNTTYTDATPGVSGLMPGADKTRFDGLGILTYQNVSVPVSAWSADSTYPGYPYKAEIPVGDQTNKIDFTSYVPTVIFSVDQISSYGPAPVALSGLGKVTVYTLVKEETNAISIPTIQMVKGG